MNENTARNVFFDLQHYFPGIDAHLNRTRQPDFNTATFKESWDIAVYYEHVCVLVITSEYQYVGFKQISAMLIIPEVKGGE